MESHGFPGFQQSQLAELKIKMTIWWPSIGRMQLARISFVCMADWATGWQASIPASAFELCFLSVCLSLYLVSFTHTDDASLKYLLTTRYLYTNQRTPCQHACCVKKRSKLKKFLLCKIVAKVTILSFVVYFWASILMFFFCLSVCLSAIAFHVFGEIPCLQFGHRQYMPFM
jgi:hypothetical protein